MDSKKIIDANKLFDPNLSDTVFRCPESGNADLFYAICKSYLNVFALFLQPTLIPSVSSSSVRLSSLDLQGKKQASFFRFGLKNANKATQVCCFGETASIKIDGKYV